MSTRSPINCPRCGVALESVHLDALDLDHCVRCGGLWFRREDLDILRDLARGRPGEVESAVVTALASIPSKQSPVTKHSPAWCPVCRTKMDVDLFGPPPPVLIDRCSAHGWWCDHGEAVALFHLFGSQHATEPRTVPAVNHTKGLQDYEWSLLRPATNFVGWLDQLHNTMLAGEGKIGGSVGFGKRSIHKPGPTDVALKMEVQLLRGVLEAVLLASAQGENINLEHPEIRKLMGVSPEASSEEIRRKLMQSRSPVLGRVDCGNCGGAVQQREGVDTVECHCRVGRHSRSLKDQDLCMARTGGSGWFGRYLAELSWVRPGLSAATGLGCGA